MSAKRCKCHPSAYYSGCGECPKCGHWSLDLFINMCERRKCSYVGPDPKR